MARSDTGHWVRCTVVFLFLAGCSSTDTAEPVGGSGVTPQVDMMPAAADMATAPKPAPVVHQVAGVDVSTLAGSSDDGGDDAMGGLVRFKNPVGIALAASGDLYVTEYDAARIRTLSAGGVSGTLTAGQSGFIEPFGIVPLGPDQLLVETDTSPSGVKDATSGTLWTVSTTTGVATVLVESLGRPRGLAFLSPTEVLVADARRNSVSLLDPTSGAMTTLSDQLHQPLSVTVMPDQSFIVADSEAHCLMRLYRDGTLSVFAGDGTAGMIDGPAQSARFDRPISVSADLAGNVYVSDQGENHRIRRVNVAGQVETIAGDGLAGFVNGTGAQAEFYGQEMLTVSSALGVVYVADGNGGDSTAYHRIRKIVLR